MCICSNEVSSVRVCVYVCERERERESMGAVRGPF